MKKKQGIYFLILISFACFIIYITGERASFGLLILFFFTLFFISKYSSLGSILSSLTIPTFIYFNSSYENEYFFIIMFVLILYTHRENVKRLINKEESKTKIY